MQLLMLGTLLFAVASTSEGETAARALALEYAQQTHGNVTFLVSTNSDVRGGPFHRIEQSDTLYAVENGTAKRKHVRSVIKDGKAAEAAELTQLSAAPDGPVSRFGMAVPYETATLGDYTFSAPHHAGAGATLDFTPLVHDSAHGSGTITYGPNNRIVAVTFTPAVLPKEPGAVLTAVSIEILFGPVMPERWDVVKITRSFTGHNGPFSGHGTVISAYQEYRSFETAAAAIAAVETASP